MENDRKITIRKTCSWCGKVIEEGDQLVPVTNGICEECKKEQLELVGIFEDGDDQ